MRWAAAVIVGLLLAAEVRADAGPIFPGLKLLDADYRIELAADLPDSVLVVWRTGYAISPSTGKHEELNHNELIDLSPGQTVALGPVGQLRSEQGRTWQRTFLYLAERDAIKPGMSPQEIRSKAESLTNFDYRTVVPSWYENHITITYRIQRNPAGDGWELVQTSRNPMRQWQLAIGFITVAVLLTGVWLIRRKRRAAAAVAASSTPG